MQDSARATDEDWSSDLVWVKPKWSRRQFELRAGDTVVATVAWGRGSSAVAQWGDLQYRFSRQGWFRPRILVRTTDSDDAGQSIATYTQRGGMLRFPDGRAFSWTTPKRWTNERVWVDGAGIELVRFHPGRRSAVAVTTPPEAAQQSDLSLLILLGQYLIALAAKDTEDAVAATTAAVIAST